MIRRNEFIVIKDPIIHSKCKLLLCKVLCFTFLIFTISANQLNSMMSSFTDEQQSLQQAMNDETEWMNKLKEALAKCDDASGSTEELIARYETAKVCSPKIFLL